MNRTNASQWLTWLNILLDMVNMVQTQKYTNQQQSASYIYLLLYMSRHYHIVSVQHAGSTHSEPTLNKIPAYKFTNDFCTLFCCNKNWAYIRMWYGCYSMYNMIKYKMKSWKSSCLSLVCMCVWMYWFSRVSIKVVQVWVRSYDVECAISVFVLVLAWHGRLWYKSKILN